ncbi:hypothetical protein HK105_200053 [Polyrhizophydium stewartii]|uniref:Centrosomin N-terminal motif 1 domain-containing protein n=1 Tax=Polyrhizophydium stewartii TaxID=2732419 RepID=A0ABR4NKD6_9FUNG
MLDPIAEESPQTPPRQQRLRLRPTQPAARQAQPEQDHMHLLLSPKEFTRFQLELLREDFDEVSSDDIAGGGLSANTTWAAMPAPARPGARNQYQQQPHPHQQQPELPAAAAGLGPGQPATPQHATPQRDPDTPHEGEVVSMGLRLREKLIDDLKKENFGLKMRVYFLTENLQKMSPEGVREIVNEHAELKAIVEDLRLEARLREQAHATERAALEAESEHHEWLTDLQTKRARRAELEAKIAGLEARLAEADAVIAEKQAAADSVAIELQAAYKSIMEGEQEHAKARAEWTATKHDLEDIVCLGARWEQQLELALSGRHPGKLAARTDRTTSPVVPGFSTMAHGDSMIDEQLEDYRRQIREFEAMSVVTSKELTFLKSELERQTRKLKSMEEKCREDAEKRRAGRSSDSSEQLEGKGKERNQRRKNESQYEELSNETMRLIPESSSGLTEKDYQALVAQLLQRLELAQATGADVTELINMISNLRRMLPNQQAYDENRMRYISELKQRNLLLVQVNQRLDSVLSDETLKSKAIKNFSDLRTTIHVKLEALKRQHEEFEAASIERRLAQSKMSAMEMKLARALQPDRRVQPGLLPGRGPSPGAGGIVLGAAAPSADRPLSLGEYDDMRTLVRELQGKLEVARQDAETEKRNAKMRIDELMVINKQLEADLLQCSKSIAQFEMEHNAASKHVRATNEPNASPERAKLLKLNNQLRTDLGEQASQSGAMRDQMRKLKLQLGKALSEQERLRRALDQREQMMADALRKLNVLRERRVSDPEIVKQIAEQARQCLAAASPAPTS